VGRTEDVRQIEERMVDAELAGAERFVPPRVDAGLELRVSLQVVEERGLVEDGAAGHVHQDRVGLHPFRTAPGRSARGWRG